MKFCERCGGLLLPKKIEDKQVLFCNACGGFAESPEYKIVDRFEEKEGVPIIEGGIATLPTAHTRCPSCGNDTAFWWIRQTRRADEPPTRFHRCTRCGHTWREYS